MALRTRKPTGKTPWPFILIEGGEKTGKSWAMAELTASDRVGRAFWLDLAEGAADEYAAIPGADYEVIEHNGTFRDIYDQLTEVHAIATKAAEAGEAPVALLIDSMTAEWELLKDMVSDRARRSKYAQKLLRDDPDAEIKPAMNLWNDAAERHGRLMRLLMTFPGIVVATARGKEVAALDNQGKPIPNTKEYKVEGHKNLAFDASAWVRLSRDTAPRVIGVRSVHAGIRPGVDKPIPAPSFTLEWLIFEVLKCDPATAKPREYMQLVANDPKPEPQQETAPEQPAADAPSVADRARVIVGRKTARPVTEEDEQRAAALRATIEREDVSREDLQTVWKDSADLPPTLCSEIRAQATERSKSLGADAA
ncbi:AAA family ATPase [Nocardia acidivorans]|uniref:AAA family ATPase n=1 Tax=Nocardia acidivorans TaxID=404580 RepID=UPI0008367781|nr:AAA family ATPase [Nocardia acidivorans]